MNHDTTRDDRVAEAIRRFAVRHRGGKTVKVRDIMRTDPRPRAAGSVKVLGAAVRR